MIRLVLVKDYGSHTKDDSIHSNERPAVVELGRLVDEFRKKGYAITFGPEGITASAQGHRVTIYLQKREGFSDAA